MARFFVLIFLILLGIASIFAAVFAIALGAHAWWVLVAVCMFLLIVAVHDITQTKHAILRNFPVLGHTRFFFEFIRPEIQQYFIERNTDGKPFDRDTRSLIYSRAKGADSHKAFGTERDVNQTGYEYLLHSTAPASPPADQHSVHIGSSQCTVPARVSLLNISSMSFGSLSKNAVLAMNKGAAMGDFIHETGEGGLTEFHLRYGAPVFWEIGSGYFGCRTDKGRFNPEVFAQKAAHEAV